MLATEPLSIRAYDASDDAFIAAVAREAFDEFTPRAVPHTLDIVRHNTTLIALRDVPERDRPANDGAPRRVRAGFAAVSVEGRGTLVLNAIAVVRSERGRGIGHRLLLAVERLAQQRGVERVELCTADCNLAALDLFFRHGFSIVRRRERFYERGQAACILVKLL